MIWTDELPAGHGWFYLRSRKTGRETIGRLLRIGVLFADRDSLHKPEYILRNYEFGPRVPTAAEAAAMTTRKD